MSDDATPERRIGKSPKVLLPQIIAAIVAASCNIVIGISVSYSAILNPQLLEAKSDLEITKSESLWLASCFTIVSPVGSIIGGFIMDSMGRLSLLRLMTIPSTLGWLLIALSSNFPMILLGRMLTSAASAWGLSASIVYIAEISRVDLRGSLTSVPMIFLSIGSMLAYLKGYFLHWRTIAWLCTGYSIILLLLLTLIPESPPWLVSADKTSQVKKSLKWFHQYEPAQKSLAFVEKQLTLLQKEREMKREKQGELLNGGHLLKTLKLFLLPTGYKPLFILIGLSIFQQFVGIAVIIFHGVMFFKDIGTKIDPYLMMVTFGIIYLIMSIINIWSISKFKRRTLFVLSSLGMGVSIGTSALFTSLLQKGLTTQHWVPPSMIMMYTFFSMVGFVPITFIISAELFPIGIRGIGSNIIYVVKNLAMFVALHTFYDLNELLGGSSGMQLFFLLFVVASLVFYYVFLPETYNKKLMDIEEYFWHHTAYLFVVYEKEGSGWGGVKKTENSESLV